MNALKAAAIGAEVSVVSTLAVSSFRLPRMRLAGCAAMLAGLSVITGEAASLAFENLIFQRTRPVIERDLANADIAHDAKGGLRTGAQGKSPG
jgi:hypothetical protein